MLACRGLVLLRVRWCLWVGGSQDMWGCEFALWPSMEGCGTERQGKHSNNVDAGAHLCQSSARLERQREREVSARGHTTRREEKYAPEIGAWGGRKQRNGLICTFPSRGSCVCPRPPQHHNHRVAWHLYVLTLLLFLLLRCAAVRPVARLSDPDRPRRLPSPDSQAVPSYAAVPVARL